MRNEPIGVSIAEGGGGAKFESVPHALKTGSISDRIRRSEQLREEKERSTKEIFHWRKHRSGEKKGGDI